MIAEPPLQAKGGQRTRRAWLFPIGVTGLYGALYLFFPDRILSALEAGAKVALSLVVPLALVFAILLLVNLFVRPSRVAGLLGKRAGAKGMILPLVAGILSAGPIFAWYPLLKKLKEEGAGEGPMAVFLYNRAIKPFLLPVMIGYYGWRYVLVLTLLMIPGSLVLGYVMRIFAPARTGG